METYFCSNFFLTSVDKDPTHFSYGTSREQVAGLVWSRAGNYAGLASWWCYLGAEAKLVIFSLPLHFLYESGNMYLQQLPWLLVTCSYLTEFVVSILYWSHLCTTGSYQHLWAFKTCKTCMMVTEVCFSLQKVKCVRAEIFWSSIFKEIRNLGVEDKCIQVLFLCWRALFVVHEENLQHI